MSEKDKNLQKEQNELQDAVNQEETDKQPTPEPEKEPTSESEKSETKTPETKDTAETKTEEKVKENNEPEAETANPLEVKLQEMTDKYLRLSAEFDNYRKRTLNEKMELTKTAGESIFKDLLPILDNFERGLLSATDTADLKAVKDGILLTINQFKDFLKQKGVKEMEALHQEFNTDVHDALTKIPAPKKKLKGKVVDVIEKGYFLHDKVIRFAKVVIGE